MDNLEMSLEIAIATNANVLSDEELLQLAMAILLAPDITQTPIYAKSEIVRSFFDANGKVHTSARPVLNAIIEQRTGASIGDQTWIAQGEAEEQAKLQAQQALERAKIAAWNTLSQQGKEQTRMTTPYESGWKQGQWTEQQVRECGGTSAKECLEHQEQVYREKIADLPALYDENSEHAAQHAEFLEGFIVSARTSLGKLIEQESCRTKEEGTEIRRGVSMANKTFSYCEEDISDLEHSGPTDLREEYQSHKGEAMELYIIGIEGTVEDAIALYFPESKRMGIAWGADATWADVDDVESGIAMWVNDNEEWERRN